MTGMDAACLRSQTSAGKSTTKTEPGRSAEKRSSASSLSAQLTICGSGTSTLSLAQDINALPKARGKPKLPQERRFGALGYTGSLGADWGSSNSSAEALDPFDPRTWCEGEPEPCCIQLSDRFDVYAIVDPEDHAWARHHRWYHTYGSGRFIWIGGVRVIERPDSIYAIRSVGDTKVYLHREILTRWKGWPPSTRHVGDHLNGDTLLCRRKNLRWATKSQNRRNVAGSRTRARFLQTMGGR